MAHEGARSRSDAVASIRRRTNAVAGMGLVGLSIGLYLLLVEPSEAPGIANLYRLTLGQTFTISGSVFLAASFVGAAAAGL